MFVTRGTVVLRDMTNARIKFCSPAHTSMPVSYCRAVVSALQVRRRRKRQIAFCQEVGDNWWSPTARNPSLHEPHLAETISVGQRPRSTCISTDRQALPVVLSPYHTLKSIWPIRNASSHTPVPPGAFCFIVWYSSALNVPALHYDLDIFFSFSWHAASWWGYFLRSGSLERHHSPESPVAWLPRFVGIKAWQTIPPRGSIEILTGIYCTQGGENFPILVFSVTLRECMLVGYRNKTVLVEMWVCMYSSCSTRINRIKLFINIINRLIRTDVINGVINNVGLLTWVIAWRLYIKLMMIINSNNGFK